MLWYNLRLRTRMLLGYGLMFALIAALALFLTFRSAALNAQIQQVNAEVTVETTTSAQLTSQVAAAQQAIDRYLQQPQPDNLRMANESLRGLADQIASARAGLANPQQRQRLDDLASQLARYQKGFQTLSAQLESQATLRGDLNQHLFDASMTLNSTITKYLNSGTPDPPTLSSFVKAQANLQLAGLWSGRLVNEQMESLGQNALDELAVANLNLKLRRDVLDSATRTALDDTVSDTTLVTTMVSQYMATLPQVRQLRNTLLTEQGGRLKELASAIAAAALGRLTNATTDLEQQSRQTQLLTGVALLLTLLLTAAFGGLIPRSITRPLMDLVAATRRLNQGDYAVAVTTRDGSEIGQLAAAFNQMTAALSQQRAEVLHQQAALAERNQELEQTLVELRTTTAAREQLAVAVRALSVPVVPIMKQVIMIPLVGEIDAPRAQSLLERLLDGITAQRARLAILDITGVPVIDACLVDWLLKATSAARLMGARCILVGISPEVAEALVASGADLSNLTTRADLRNAVESAIQTVMR